MFVFTANPEDYTNRGSIVTPLKDRIESQIVTHYPKTVDVSRAITEQEADVLEEQTQMVEVPEMCKLLIEEIAMEARKSEYVDQKSGVSARLTIAAYENLVSTAERRALRAGIKHTMVRLSDMIGVVPAITGKIELVYEGEQEGPMNVAYRLIGQAIRTLFLQYFPDPQSFKKAAGREPQNRKSKNNPYQSIIDWFGKGNDLALLQDDSEDAYVQNLYRVDGLYAAVKQFYPNADEKQAALMMEFLLHGLSEFSLISKKGLDIGGYTFGDILGSMMNLNLGSHEEDEEDFN
jgi:magnesium chelatase subunit I